MESKGLMNDADLDLINSIQNGDVFAFERLVKRYQNPLLNFVFRLLRDRDGAEELVQEVFLRVYKAASKFKARPDAKVSSWIFKIAYNLSINEIKRRRRFAEFKTGCARDEEKDMRQSLEPIRIRELENEITSALQKLPEGQKAALLLRVREGLTYKEISEVLNVSVPSVEALIFRARKYLREQLL